MTILTSYDDTDRLGRVRLTFSGYNALADYAVVERSIDQVNWSVVRGGNSVTLTGGAGTLDDYEFTANTLNYYRVTAWNNTGSHFVGAGTAGSADNASISSGNGLGLPAGLTTGDTMLLFVANRDFTASVNTPAGWTLRLNFSHVRVFERVATASESVPTVSFTGSGTGDTCQAQIAAWRFMKPGPVSGGLQSAFNSGQNIPVPATTPSLFTRPPLTAVAFGWKQDDCTTVDPITGYTMIGTTPSTLGDDQTITWATRNFVGANPATEFVVNGGTAASNRGLVDVWEGTFTNRETTSITPVVTRYRIKSPTRPSLNMFIDPVRSKLVITRPSRSAEFNVLSRTLPVAVTDLAGSRRFTLKLDTKGDANKSDTDNRLATGGVYFLQPPSPVEALPTMYFILSGIQLELDTEYFSDSYTFVLDLIEVAAPPAEIYGGTTTWQDIITDFATWSALLATEPTWADVIDRVSDSNVIVP